MTLPGFHQLRKPCPCGCEHGRIDTRNGQDCVYCLNCSRWQYNAPKAETGRSVRSVKTTHEAISTSQRYRIIERSGRHCELCHKEAELHVGHIVSVERGHKVGMSDMEINSDENLMALCAECNLGMSSKPLPIRIYLQILRHRLESANEGAA